jgi:hypothetical protein
MNIQNHFTRVTLVTLFVSSIAFCDYVDSGFITKTQPNAVTFQARHWNDDFEWHFETEEGTVMVPKVLVPFTGFAVIGGRKG